MSVLAGRTFLVTGASSGIGRALTAGLLERGAEVLGVTRRPEALDEAVFPLIADLRERDQVEGIFNTLGRIDGLVNCAGVAYLARVTDGDPDLWEEMWQVNVRALAICCQRSLAHFPRDGGRIVNVSSMSGHRVPAGGGFYAPTKFAVRALTDSLRAELKAIDSRVQVSCVSPGFVDTPLLETYFQGREEALERTRGAVRMLKPEDVAASILHILEAPPHVEIGDILLRSGDQRA
jgi:NADP-dependent 3-hydroxy acid dehydrogenase YdfG